MSAPKRRWHDLDEREQRAALARGQEQTGRGAALLEKDVWVVWALDALFTGCALGPGDAPVPDRARMVFKGGTSLSKAYGYIDRFSENLDITLELAAHDGQRPPDTRGLSRNRRDAYRDEYRALCLGFIETAILPALEQHAQQSGAPLSFRLDSSDEATPSVWVDYPTVTAALGYLTKAVKFEFGARNVITPAHRQSVISFLSEVELVAAQVDLPTATPEVLDAERTFLEKATALHVLCRRAPTLAEDVLARKTHRFARHLRDLCALDRQGVAARALTDTELIRDVIATKEAFFKEDGVNYAEVLEGKT